MKYYNPAKRNKINEYISTEMRRKMQMKYNYTISLKVKIMINHVDESLRFYHIPTTYF